MKFFFQLSANISMALVWLVFSGLHIGCVTSFSRQHYNYYYSTQSLSRRWQSNMSSSSSSQFVLPDKKSFESLLSSSSSSSTSSFRDSYIGDDSNTIRKAKAIGKDDDTASSAAATTTTTSDASSSNSAAALDFGDFEEKERREMEWLVRSTDNIIGNDAPPVGSLKSHQITRGFEVMRAWARRSSKPESNAPHVVERILRRLLDERDSGNRGVKITTYAYNVVIDAWSKSDEDGAAQRAEEVLSLLENMYEMGNQRVKPDINSYNGVIKAWVKGTQRTHAVTKAEAIINRMSTKGQLQPNRRGYNLLLYALANSYDDDAADRAEEILHKMEIGYAEGDESVVPDINSYNQVIGCFARGRKKGFEYKAQAIFEDLLSHANHSDVKPNTDTFNAILGCWLKSNDENALQYIEETLELMDECYSHGNSEAKPDRISVNTAIAAYARLGKDGSVEKAIELHRNMNEKYKVQPDAISNNIVIDSWAKSGRSDAPERILQILNDMERDFKNGNINMKPDKYTYSSVIDSFGKCNPSQAGIEGEKVLEQMWDLYRIHGGDKPDDSVYNSVMNAWCESNSKESVQRVEKILHTMEENPDVPNPTRMTYNTMLKVLRNNRNERGGGAKAEKILKKLEELSKQDPQFTPDCYSYTAAITAYGRSSNPDKASKALGILEGMIESYREGNKSARPNIQAFNAALNACAFSMGSRKQRLEAFLITVSIMFLLQEYSRADQVTYSTILRACSNLIPKNDPKRDDFAKSVFEKCCRDGQVGTMVLTQLKFAASPGVYESLTGLDPERNVNPKAIPSSWTKNVRQERFPNRQDQTQQEKLKSEVKKR